MAEGARILPAVMRERNGLAFVAACSIALLTFGACLPGAGAPLLPDEDGGDPSNTNLSDDGGLQRFDVDLGDPFALDGLTPSHGPFLGGTRTNLSGRGFSSKLRVYLGDTEVPPASVLASDPTRAAIVTPPGAPGLVDVRIRDDATAQERVLKNGYSYDAFVVEPNTGATSGGTRISVKGSGTAFRPNETKVTIGGVACANVVVASAAALDCSTPPGAPGAKDVAITTSASTLQARDAFTYSDSPDGYRGGLQGGAFSGRVRVLVFDALTGVPLAGAKAIAGSSLASGVVQSTTKTGVTEFSGLPGNAITVTAGAKCHQPMTYVDVPVDTVTMYLQPVLDPDCAEGDPPSTGGRGGRYGGVVDGNLIFPGGAEFKRTGWTNIPVPTRPTERRAAYVFDVAPSPSEPFQLPPPSEAITPDTPGTSGYTFSRVVFPGNVTLYVLAGLEDRSADPPTFVPYAMGIARGISVPPQTRVTGVDVKMDILVDHQITLAPRPPLPGPRGPDRFEGSVAMTLGNSGFALVPQGRRVVNLPAPATLPIRFVPSLDHAAAGEHYVLGGTAATGADLRRPASTVSRIRTTNANDPIVLGGFLGVPVLAEPAAGTWGGTHVAFTGATGPVDFHVVEISSGGGLISWIIASPGGVSSFDVPDLAQLSSPDNVGLVRGAITTTVRAARIDGFAYGKIRQGQLIPTSWNAHAFDTLSGAY